MARRLTVLGVAAVLASLPAIGAAEVYKWTDERGVINYSSTPPKNQKAATVSEDTGRVTVVPPLSRPSEPASQAVLRNRVDRLEQELDAERTRSLQQSTVPTREQQMQAWRQRCINEKWADCDDERALITRYSTDPRWATAYGYYSPYGTYVAPPVVRPIRPPLVVAPPPPPPPPVVSAPRAQLPAHTPASGGTSPARRALQ